MMPPSDFHSQIQVNERRLGWGVRNRVPRHRGEGHTVPRGLRPNTCGYTVRSAKWIDLLSYLLQNYHL
jgi:hypothetical protein